MIRLAHARPELRPDLLPLLRSAGRTKRELVKVPRLVRTRIQHLPAGEYLVEMPFHYDAREVTGEDIIYDPSITVVDE